MKKTLTILLLTYSLSACHDIPEYTNDCRGNFEALWTVIDEHYCFFSEKDVDWNEVHERYSSRIDNNMTQEELFAVCSDMLAELRDGHTNLSSAFATSYYRDWWSDYPQNYSARLIQQYYFNFNYRSLGAYDYDFLAQNIGYVHCSSFQSGLGAGNLDYVLQYFNTAQALIFDVRDNGGGNLDNVEDIVNRFIDTRTLAGYMVHKTGPGHNDFSEPYPYYFNPAGDGHRIWRKPVAVLTNRSTFSAANNFVSIMKLLPNVTIIGATTGGGSGMPYSSEIPCGWGVRFSACSILDAKGNTTEFGVEPTEGCHVDMDPQQALNGHDTILDFAISYFQR